MNAPRKDIGKVKAPERVTVALSCQHTVIYPKPAPAIGQDVFCYRCNASRMVIPIGNDLHVKCRNCRYSRNYGVALHAARGGMWRHQSRKPSHTVDLWKSGKVSETYESAYVPFLDHADDCPF